MSGSSSDSHIPDPSDPRPGEAVTPTPPGPASRILPREMEFGNYRLLERIGEGGMGEVWRAEQRTAVRQVVAVKIIKLGLDTEYVIARFDAERQALAIMNHPGICRVIDAGATPSGRPYFAMEYVPGKPITQYCDEHKLPIAARLELFAKVCDAVQHAHTKGIIHRDIKPSNVLVAEVDGKPVPKVIDFGVAKATNQRLTERTLFTETGRMVGTPEYMSPEQAGGEADIDTRADVYSLGVLLYELLTGAPPFDRKTLLSKALDEIVRIIREVEPPHPSTLFSSASDASKAAAERRAASAEEMADALRRELEWIPLRAMKKDRRERYEHASDLRRDIENYLAKRPLLAGPDSWWYRAKKSVRRNKGPFAAAAGIAIALMLGMITTSWQMLEARQNAREANENATAARLAQAEAERQKARAQDRLERQQAAATFVYNVFMTLAATGQIGDPAPVLEAVDEAQKRIEVDFPKAVSRAGYLRMLADLCFAVGAHAKAEPLYEESLKYAREVYATADSEAVLSDNDYEVIRHLTETCQSYSRLLLNSGKYEQALALAQEALDAALRTPEDLTERAVAEANLAAALEKLGKFQEAKPLLESALARMQQWPEKFGPGQRAAVAANLGAIAARLGDLEEAEKTFATAVRILEDAAEAAEPLDLANKLQNWSRIAFLRGDMQAALERLDRCSAARDQFLRADHSDRQREWEIRGDILEGLQDFAGAAEALKQAHAIESAKPEERRNAAYLETMAKRIAENLRRAGKVEEAEVGSRSE